MSDKRQPALVVGGSGGIGQAVCRELTKAGWTVVAPSHAELDVSSTESIERWFQAEDRLFDGLAMCAGMNDPQPFDSTSSANWNLTQSTNVSGPFELCRRVVPAMADRGFGRVLAVSSAYAVRARPGRAAYSASKAALEALVRTVAVEFAGRGVVANCIAPGFVETRLTTRNNSQSAIADLLRRIPAGRLAHPDEVARVAAFLLDESNTYVTGQTISVDGGYSCT